MDGSDFVRIVVYVLICWDVAEENDAMLGYWKQ